MLDLWATGLLVAMILPYGQGACPHGYVRAMTDFQGISYSSCCTTSECTDYYPLAFVSNDNATAPFLQSDALCQPATKDFPCCAPVVEGILLDDGFEYGENTAEKITTLCATRSSTRSSGYQCTQQLESWMDEDFAFDCLPPPAEPAEPADLDGATVGTIVVACLVGVALVGGAIAVHLQV
jgi:hypothetical protein